MEKKSLRPQVKQVDDGKALIVLATLNVKDHDGDVTLPGFFGEQIAPIVGAHNWSMVPIGKARVFEQGSEAIAELSFNRDTIAGKDWHSAILFDFQNPPAKQQYSYGFGIKSGGWRDGEFEGGRVRFLQPLEDGTAGAEVHEVSPVLLGAGVGTRTLDAKGQRRKFSEQIEAAIEDVGEIVARGSSIVEMRQKEGRGLSEERRKQIGDLATLLGKLHAQAESMKALIAEPKDPVEAENLYAEYLATQARVAGHLAAS